MARSRLRNGLASAIVLGLLTSSLWFVPATNAVESPETEPSSSAEPAPDESPSPEPSASPSPEAEPSPAASPTPTSDQSPSPSASPSATASPSPTPTDACSGDNPCLLPPQITNVTPAATEIAVAWKWSDSSLDFGDGVGVVLELTPGDREIAVNDDVTSALITDLFPETIYTIVAYAIGGTGDAEERSIASEPFTVTTLADRLIRPTAEDGDISRLIVTTYSDAAPAAGAQSASAELAVDGVEVAEVREIGNEGVVIELDKGVSESTAKVISEDLETDPRIESVELDDIMRLTTFPDSPPNDTSWNSLWGLHGTYGIGIASGSSSMNNVWSSGQGNGAIVAVLDTGSTVHPDLDANYVAGYDFVSDSSPATAGCDARVGATSFDGDYISTGTYGAVGWDDNPLDPGDWENCSDSSWHGTHVAGTIAAVGNNSAGVIGVAPEAKIQPVRVLSYRGGWTSDIAAGITWASGGNVSGVPVNANPADVINLSLGGRGSCSTTMQTAIDGAIGRGSVVVVSAGNRNEDASLHSPANCNNVITVASSTSSGVRSSFSNYGSTVEITAPGSGILSTMNSGTTTPGSATYATYSGTSMAAPHVSGVAALLKAADGTRTSSQILTLMQSTVQAFPTTGGLYDCTTSECGPGLLTAAAAANTAPTIIGISPSSGSTSGNDVVTITGTNLTGTSGITFGGASGTSVTVNSATSVTVTTPSASAGAKDVVLTTTDGSVTSVGGFTYYAAPTISSLDVTSGPTVGGTSVVITGTELAATSSVTFGGTAATITARSSTTVTVTTPAKSAGTVDVIVTTSAGSVTAASAYEFKPFPIITSYSTDQGSVTGGDVVTITGSNLTGTTGVTFDGASGTDLTVTSTTVTVTTPAGTEGLADVAVTNASGTTTDTNAFRYFPVPVATSLTATSGTTAGGTQVTIQGSGFANSDVQTNQWISVSFGGTNAMVWLVSQTSAVVTTPARSAGTVDVVVTTPGGTSTLTSAFTFVAPPAPPTSNPPASAPASSSGGGGGGGGDNEITAVAPSAAGSPGSVVAFTGWGLSTTRGVTFNDYPASYTVVSDGHVQVTVPDIPEGVYVVHAILAPEVGRASYWPGFLVRAAGAAPPPSAAAPSAPSAPSPPPATSPTDAGAADFVTFSGRSTSLTKSTRTKVARLAKQFPQESAHATIVTFADARGSAASIRRAQTRAENIESLLKRSGFPGSTTINVQEGGTKLQQRGSLIYIDPTPAVQAAAQTEGVSSLIVRVKKGRSITVNGEVRGSNRVTGPLGDSLTVGPYLGLRMYRIDFDEPVSVAEAERVAQQLMRDRGIEFAEPDSIVSTQVSITL